MFCGAFLEEKGMEQYMFICMQLYKTSIFCSADKSKKTFVVKDNEVVEKELSLLTYRHITINNLTIYIVDSYIKDG